MYVTRLHLLTQWFDRFQCQDESYSYTDLPRKVALLLLFHPSVRKTKATVQQHPPSTTEQRKIKIKMTKPQATLPSQIKTNAINRPSAEAVDGTTYSDLQALTDRYVANLPSTGIQRGDAVCLMFTHKSVHAVALALAIMRLGATYVPLSSTFPSERLSKQCRTLSGALKLVLYGTEEVDRSRAEAVGETLNIAARSIDAVRSELEDRNTTTDISAWDDLALVLFTSGSTGPPKATGWKHRHLTASLEACTDAFGLGPHTRVCNVVPYVWDAANLDIFGALLRGGAVVFAHDMTAAGIARTIAEKECTYMVGPSSLLQTIPVDSLALLYVLVSGGEGTSAAQFREWSEGLVAKGTRLFNGYGLTETGVGNLAWECPADFPGDIESIPLGLPFGDNAAVIEEGTGEIVVSGPQVTEGYIGVESPAFVAPPSVYSREHWALRTGDRGWKDEEGRFHIEGRLDDRLSIASLRIEQAETEAAALKVPEIDFAHLFVHELGEGLAPSLVLAYHVGGAPSTEGPLSRNEYATYAGTHEKRLREQMEVSVPGYQRPSSYIPLGSIPRTISQKKDAKQIAALAAELHKSGLVEMAPFDGAM